MTQNRQTTWDDWLGADIVGKDGEKIGTLGSVYMDDATGQPEWLAVKTGLFGRKESFVPIQGADADGDDLRVPYEKNLVKDAPNVDPEGGHLDPPEEEELYRFYGRELQPAAAGRGRAEKGKGKRSGDDAMTRSEEEVAVGKRPVETGRARLRKYVVTENVTTTVPVRRERVRVEREPITDANRDEAMSGPEISEAEHEVTLHEEEPVTEKRTVPKERVRLAKDVETGQEEVSEDVRKERIEAESDSRQRKR